MWRFAPTARSIVAGLLGLLTAVLALFVVDYYGGQLDRPDVRVSSLATIAPTTSTTVAPSTSTSARFITPRPPRADRAALRPLNATGEVNGYPCGGDLPPCRVLRRESGGNPTAVNARGCGGRSCGGLWQFDPWTWVGMCGRSRCADYRGYARAELAPAEVQNDRARELWRGGAGCGHWAACG